MQKCMAMTSLEWNDYQLLLKIAEAGSLSGAARKLGTTQSTVSRRLKSLEERSSGPLFFYKGGSYAPAPQAMALIEKAKLMEAAVLKDPEQDFSQAKPVRVTTVEFVVAEILLPFFRNKSVPPLDIGTSIHRENIRRRGFDIAIRMDRPAVTGLYKVKKLIDLNFAVYTRTDIANKYDSKWIHFGDEFAFLPDVKWIQKNVKPADTHAIKANSYLSLAAALDHLDCRGVLPAVLGDSRTHLTRVSGPETLFKRPVWLVVQESSLLREEVRLVKDLIIEAFARIAALNG